MQATASSDGIQCYLNQYIREKHVRHFQDSIFVIDLLNDLNYAQISQIRQSFLSHCQKSQLKVPLIKFYQKRHYILQNFNITEIYVVDMRHPRQIGSNYLRKNQKNSHSVSSKYQQFLDWFKKTAVSAIHQLGITIVPALYEADHQIAYIYRQYQKINNACRCYAVSEDVDFFFLQVPQIKKIYMLMEGDEVVVSKSNKEFGFGRKLFGMCQLFDFGELQIPKSQEVVYKLKDMYMNNKYKLSLLKSLSGTKTLERVHFQLKLKDIIRQVDDVQWQGGVQTMASAIEYVVYALKEKYPCGKTRKQEEKKYREQVKKETIYWLCASINDPFRNTFGYLDEEYLFSFARTISVKEEEFQENLGVIRKEITGEFYSNFLGIDQSIVVLPSNFKSKVWNELYQTVVKYQC